MGCSKCPGVEKNKSVDSRGNIIGNKSAEAIAGPHNRVSTDSIIREVTYASWLEQRNEFREASRQAGNAKVTEFSDDYKRIQIDELVSVVNNEEVHFKLTPSQALVALWEFSHHPAYTKIFNEFRGLREQIDLRYQELQKNKIKIDWVP